MTVEIKENEPLSNHSTFRIGGPVKYFVLAKNTEEVVEAVNFAKEKNLPFFVLGGGSNILFPDNGYDGLVIKLSNINCLVSGISVTAFAGTPLALLINKSTGAGLSGLEWAMGIPGTIGGAVAGNAGAYGHSAAENIKSVTILNEEGEIKKYTKDDCDFGYRTSKFKKPGNKEIILEVELGLQQGSIEEGKNKIKEILETRKGKVPTQPSAGSVFKNLIASDLSAEVIAMIPPEKIKGGKVPMAYLIEACGLKGKKVGEAVVSEMHAGFIVNTGGATAQDVLTLMDICKKEVKNKFGIDLEEEIIVLPRQK